MAHAVVLVLGDLGRSPRMQYHASSLSHVEGISAVTQIGYVGERIMFPCDTIVTEKRLTSWDFNIFRKVAIFHAVLKGAGILLKVFFTLLMMRRYDIIIIQNPPCLPALLAASFVSVLNGSVIIIDWHNLGYAMFEQRLGPKHILVRMAFILERCVCHLAHKHICVSKAMKDWLAEHFSIQATVLYDRPAKLFNKCAPSVQQRHRLLSSLGYRDEVLFPSLTGVAGKYSSTAQSLKEGVSSIVRVDLSTCQTNVSHNQNRDAIGTGTGTEGDVTLRGDAAKILVSATSWTADEDFSMLLDALLGLNTLLNTWATATEDKESKEAVGNRRVLVVVTGKGPLKAAFKASVRDLTARGLLRRVAVRTAWLSAEKYSLLLRCADLGICLHTSSSGLDLPMKVLDMFGSNLPVCAVRFPTIPELVKHGHNGLVFGTAAELTEQIAFLLYPEKASTLSIKQEGLTGDSVDDREERGTWSDKGSSADCPDSRQEEATIFTDSHDGVSLSALREGAGEIGTWDQNWNAVMRPLVKSWIKIT